MNNKAISEFGIRRVYQSRRVLSTEADDNTLLDLQNSSYPTKQPYSIFANYRTSGN